MTDCEIFKAAIFSPGNLGGHGTEVHGLLDDITVARDQLWIYGLKEEGVIVLSEGKGQSPVSELDVMTEHFLICEMSLERTSLSGFSLSGRGEAFWPSSKAPSFRFFDTFMTEDGKERRWA